LANTGSEDNMHLHGSNLETPGYREGAFRRLMGALFRPAKPSRRDRAIYLTPTAVALALVFCTLAGLGCSSDKREVEDLAFQWIEGIKNGDAETIERIIDWRLWYSVSSGGVSPGDQGANAPGRRTPAGSDPGEVLTEDQQYQKDLLISVLSADEVIAAQYLTAKHDIKRVSIKGSEALVEISQVDRTTADKRLVVLQMHKDQVAGWRIYKFRMEELEEV
jgi:hypothetical protein